MYEFSLNICMIAAYEWKTFDSSEGPRTDGLSAGLDAQGNEIYIGRGLYNSVSTPGRLVEETVGNRSAGVYIEYGGAQYRLTTNTEYYVINPNCKYKWVPSFNGSTVPNAVQVTSSKTYYIGRVFVQDSLQVGKVLLKNRMFYAYNGLGHSAFTYEVLVCGSNMIF